MFEKEKGVDNFEDAKSEKSNDKRNILIVALFAIIPLFVLALIFYAYTQLSDDDVSVEEEATRPVDGVVDESFEEATEPFDLVGELYLTLSPVTSDLPFLDIYTLDLPTRETKIFLNEDEEVLDNLTPSFSYDEGKMAFVRRYDDYTSQVMVFDVDSEEMIEISPRYGFLEMNPVISPDESEVAYWFYENSEERFGQAQTPEDNHVVTAEIGDPYLIERVKGSGAYPVYSPSGDHLMYLKNDGLYILDLNSDTESLALELDIDLDGTHGGYPAWLAWRFNISADGDMLVVTDSIDSYVYLYKINSWENFDYEEVFSDMFVEGPIWPVFSPCGNYLAMQMGVDIGVFDLNSHEMERVFDLEDYYPDSIWLSDWILKDN